MSEKIFDTPENDFTLIQKNLFEKATRSVHNKKNIKYKKHLANSAATLRSKDFHYDLVRVGLSIYGYNPSLNMKLNSYLKPAFSVKSRVTFKKVINVGEGVSYGHLFKSSKKTTLAIISIGYGDGVPRNLSGKINVIIEGNFYPQVGYITMDQLIVDISDNPNIKLGSIVTILGTDGDKSIHPIEWANKSESITWEILCGFSSRIRRLVV